MTSELLSAPFPWFGGKRRCAHLVWPALGPDVVNYVEPFFGSGAMLLGRPGGAGKIETVNDIDGGICNFWRAIAAKPDEVAHWCDWPVSELDLHARHVWLVERLAVLAEELRADPEYFDAKFAGWWVYGICLWIGTGWCDPSKLERNANVRPHVSGTSSGMGVFKQQIPDLAVPARAKHTGKGMFSHQLPALRVDSGAHGNGVHASAISKKMPNVSVGDHGGGYASRGVPVPTGLPAIGNDRGINGVAAPPCLEWFRALQARLRRVRIVCGDWKRVLGPSVLGKGKNVGGRHPCGVFLDPGYDVSLRSKKIYGHDIAGLSQEVREWAIEHGDDSDLRIALCGYEGEHDMPPGWTMHAWKGARGYASADNDNREKERIWFSRHCLRERSLFDLLEEA